MGKRTVACGVCREDIKASPQGGWLHVERYMHDHAATAEVIDEQPPTWAEVSEQLYDALNDVAHLSITVTGRGEGAVPITLSFPVNDWHTADAQLVQNTRPQLERLQLDELSPPVARPTVCRYTDLTLRFKIRPAFEPPLGPDVTDQEGPL